jgi:hypothetical protein
VQQSVGSSDCNGAPRRFQVIQEALIAAKKQRQEQHEHVGSSPNSNESADLQGQIEGCPRRTQIAKEEGRCAKGQF